MKKYELTTNTKMVAGRTLFQIKALVSFGNVKKDELGGWIEKEENLDHSGNAWVSDNARVSGNARVSDNADHLVVGPIGSRRAYTTFYRRRDGATMTVCGCFHDTLAAFEKKVLETHGDNDHARAYLAAVQFAKAFMNTNAVEDSGNE